MWLLLGTTITTSFFDSLNPSAIAQQMLLQAMVKKKRHIWFFMAPVWFSVVLAPQAVHLRVCVVAVLVIVQSCPSVRVYPQTVQFR